MVRDPEHLGATDEVREVHLPLIGAEVTHGDLHHRDNVVRLHRSAAVVGELGPRLVDHIEIDPGHRREAPPLQQHGPLTQDFRGLEHLSRGREHGRRGQPQLHQAKAHDAVVDVPKLDARKLDHVDFDALDAQLVEKRFHQLIGPVVKKEGPVKQVHANDTEGLLLRLVLAIEHAHVEDDLAVFVPGMGLELHADPAMALIIALVGAGLHGIGKGKEGRGIAALGKEPL